MLFVSIISLWMSVIRVVGLALNLWAYDFILNEGIRVWMATQDHLHENLVFPKEVLLHGKIF
jgi:hypothetical protein